MVMGRLGMGEMYPMQHDSNSCPVFTVTLNPGLDRTLTVPSLTFNTVLRATASQLDWGGKGFNVARALKALGVDSIALGFIGDATGRILARGLQEVGIATEFIEIDGETRTNTVVAEANTDRYIKVNEAGPTVPPAALVTLEERIRSLVMPDSYWVLAGSLPPGVPIDYYARLVRLIRQLGARVCLDASGEAMRQGCAAAPYLVKPNAEEAQEITGYSIGSVEDAYAAAGFFLDRGVTLAAVSLGPAGVVVGTRGRTVHAKPPEVTARTPVGVGDALLAGLIWSLRHQDMRWTRRRGGALRPALRRLCKKA